MLTERERVETYWNTAHAVPDHGNFLNHPLVAAYMSMRATGAVVNHLDVVVAEIRDRTSPGARVLSPGCGPGDKEMALARALPDRHIVGFDIAERALDIGREAAARAGLRNLEFQQADFNRLQLDRASFDVIAGLGAFHHIENLEGFWAECRRALRKRGVILGQEYVGPNRFQWTDAQVEHGDRVLRDLVPDSHKVHHARIERVSIATMLELDPSEAVRSSELLPTLRDAGFEMFGVVSGGAALLQPVLMYQVHTFDPRNWQHNRVLAQLFAEEDRLMRERVLDDDFVMFATRPLA
jgi:ubiquinone/menaquinone biosynthesis C-methylase UbiE